MTTLQRHWLWVVGMCAGVTSACGSSGPGPTEWSSEQTWSSRHFVYHARPDDSTVGPAVLDELEKDGTLVATGLLGLSSEAWGPIHYFKYRSLTEGGDHRRSCGREVVFVTL